MIKGSLERRQDKNEHARKTCVRGEGIETFKFCHLLRVSVPWGGRRWLNCVAVRSKHSEPGSTARSRIDGCRFRGAEILQGESGADLFQKTKRTNR